MAQRSPRGMQRPSGHRHEQSIVPRTMTTSPSRFTSSRRIEKGTSNKQSPPTRAGPRGQVHRTSLRSFVGMSGVLYRRVCRGVIKVALGTSAGAQVRHLPNRRASARRAMDLHTVQLRMVRWGQRWDRVKRRPRLLGSPTVQTRSTSARIQDRSEAPDVAISRHRNSRRRVYRCRRVHARAHCGKRVHGLWISHRTKINFGAEPAMRRDRRRCGSVFALSFA